MWTDIFSAGGTVGATAVAVIFGAASLFIAQRDHRARLRQDADREEQEHQAEQKAIRRQAQRVACWLQVNTNQYPSHKIIVVNASDEPIWDVQISNASILHLGLTQFSVIAPGERREIDSVNTSKPAEEAVDIRFNDNAGRRWFRPASAPGALKLESEPTYRPRAKETLTAK